MTRRTFSLRDLFAKKAANSEAAKPTQPRLTIRVNPARSIGLRLFIYFFAVIFISVSSVGFMSYDRSRELIETQVAESKRLTAVQAAEKLQLVLQQFEDTSLEMMLIPEIGELTFQYRTNPDDMMAVLELRREMETRLNTYLFSDQSLLSLHLISLGDDLPMITLGTSTATDDVKNAAWFQEALKSDGKGIWIGSSAKGPSGLASAPAFGYARVVKDQVTFSANYVMLMEIREERLQVVMKDALGENSRMYLVDPNGLIVSSPDKTQIGAPFAFGGLDGENGAIRTEVEGETMLVAYSELEGGWKFVGVQPFAPLVAGTKTIWNVTVLMLLVGTVAAVVIGWMVALRIGTPLRRMAGLMKQAEEGDLSVRSPYVKRLDEIGTLANGFNEMIANIRSLVEESHQSARYVMDTAGELGEASRRTATSAKEIAIATEQIAIGASNVAVEAEKVTDVANVMGTRMASTVQANEQMAAAAADIQKASQLGAETMHGLSAKTAETEQLTVSMVQKVEELQKSTSSIQEILVLLNNITKQTNILSLNASIEAARAGEAGRGFMVVADEIRKLADQSKQSIETVGRITNRIRGEIDETVGLMGRAYPLFQEQIASVKHSNDIFLSVNDRMGEFVQQLDSVMGAVRELERTQQTLADAMASVSAVAQQSSATTEEVASLSTDQLQVGDSLVGLAGRLEDVSVRLRDTLNKFRL
ncbi:methyl-accepting chemotaxis protein [Paenibacillus sp.]|uniref:methyl-accepting chemotaxis protein n=1 Tax=Paenibacillus sp. TaxID=58172 RepID=UPI002D5411EB|nr:methyl-accepting chemotaxis protein [Paenibacillus sp.]HZG83934.1 methyl-accepting chemotaxis protein [Paenibacillus sp.]